MTEERLVLADLLEKAGDGDFLRAVAEAVLQLLMETDVEGLIGALPLMHEYRLVSGDDLALS
jgi:putative transposase